MTRYALEACWLSRAPMLAHDRENCALRGTGAQHKCYDKHDMLDCEQHFWVTLLCTVGWFGSLDGRGLQ